MGKKACGGNGPFGGGPGPPPPPPAVNRPVASSDPRHGARSAQAQVIARKRVASLEDEELAKQSDGIED